jgi:hypothetical protein
MLWGDLGRLSHPETWFGIIFGGFFAAVVLSFLSALPLTLMLRPKPSRGA